MDDLVKRLRASVDGRYEKCDGCPYEEDYPCCVDCLDKMHKQAADAIEELSREAEEYKAKYSKEHNKRIAENRYLYDELTKAVRAKLLMTPMQIEVPEPPKEE